MRSPFLASLFLLAACEKPPDVVTFRKAAEHAFAPDGFNVEGVENFDTTFDCADARIILRPVHRDGGPALRAGYYRLCADGEEDAQIASDPWPVSLPNRPVR